MQVESVKPTKQQCYGQNRTELTLSQYHTTLQYDLRYRTPTTSTLRCCFFLHFFTFLSRIHSIPLNNNIHSFIVARCNMFVNFFAILIYIFLEQRVVCSDLFSYIHTLWHFQFSFSFPYLTKPYLTRIQKHLHSTQPSGIHDSAVFDCETEWLLSTVS